MPGIGEHRGAQILKPWLLMRAWPTPSQREPGQSKQYVNMEPWNSQGVAWLRRTVLGRVLFWAAGVVNREFAFFLLLRVELLSAMLHPITTDGCPFHRGPC